MNRVTKGDKNKAKKKKSGFGKKILLLIFLIIVAAGINFGIKVYKNGGGLQGILAATLGQDVEKLQDLDTIYVLILGISEDLDSKLTDTIILCGYNPKEQKASMLSIPRDTFVGKNRATAKSGSDKINALYSKSPEKTMEAVSKITGIDVKNYVVINNDAVIKLVDVIGGVEFDVPIDMKYDDKTQNLHIDLKKGLQKLDGEKAEQLLRFRHSNADKNGVMTTYPSSYGSDDYGRMRTQREFITETIKQTLQLKNVTKLKQITETVFENIETNLETSDILPYVPWAAGFDTSSIDSEQLPGSSSNPNETWFFFHDEKATKELVSEMQDRIEGLEEVVEEEGNIINENKINNTTSAKNNTVK